MEVREGMSMVVTNSAITLAWHPFHMVKTLVQVGHEPLAVYEGRSFPFFRHPVRRYPSAFSYVRHIRQRDGVFGLYRGLMPRLLENAISSLVSDYVLHKIRPGKNREGEIDPRTAPIQDFVVFKLKEGAERMVARSVGVIASHPFYVMGLRAIVQFVGRETMYDGMLSAISEIWCQEGIVGFFSGLIPRLTYELSAFCIAHAISSLCELLLARYGGSEEEKEKENNQDSQFQVHFFANFVGTFIAYPFQLAATLMAVNNCGLQATQPPAMPVFAGSFDCLSYLRAHNMMRQGGSIFVRSVT